MAQELGASSYLETDENGHNVTIEFNKDTPRWIVQVDSISKIKNLHSVNLFILDEVRSIINHVDQDSSKVYGFLQCLKYEKSTIIACDALLTTGIVDFLAKITGKNPKQINNTFETKKGETVKVYGVTNLKEDKNAIIRYTLGKLGAGRKLVFASDSKGLSDLLAAQIKQDYPKLTIKYYHGDHYDQNNEENKHQFKVQEEDFKDVVSCWSKVDVLIYTMTLTAGVSFDYPHFDEFIGYYKCKSCPEMFSQSLQRVRQFSRTEHTIFITPQMSWDGSGINPRQLMEKTKPLENAIVQYENSSLKVLYDWLLNDDSQAVAAITQFNATN